MPQYVVLLRGINVGGRGKLPMTQLRGVLEEIGATDIATYIQSGNVVLHHKLTGVKALEERIAQGIEDMAGFRPQILMLNRAEFRKAAEANPFPKAETEKDGKALHLFFLKGKPKPIDKAAWEAARSNSESYCLIDRVLYLHSPKGMTGSKLAPKAERWLGVPTTARNWRTVTKLMEMTG